MKHYSKQFIDFGDKETEHLEVFTKAGCYLVECPRRKVCDHRKAGGGAALICPCVSHGEKIKEMNFRAAYCTECGRKLFFYFVFDGEEFFSVCCPSCKEENWAFLNGKNFGFSGALPF